MRQLIRHRQPVIHNLTTGRWIKGNLLKLLGPAPGTVVKDFVLTPGQISASSVGYRASPVAGDLGPDAVFAGGTIILVQATDTDTLYIQPLGNVPFPEVPRHLAAALGPYIGPGRILLDWDIDRYTALVPGIYNYMVGQLALSTGLRLYAALV